MKELLESKECKDYVQAHNVEKFAAITLANTEMSGNPIATELARNDYATACRELDDAKQVLINVFMSYINELT